jgi:hypothetical protein
MTKLSTYFFSLLILASSASMGQRKQPKPTTFFNASAQQGTVAKQQAPYALNKMQLAPPFFSEDFANGIPATWSNVSNTAAGLEWTYTITGAYNTFNPVASQLSPVGTSAGNGYVKIDSDSAGPIGVEDASLTTPAINCTGHANVHLSFSEYFAQYATSTGTVSVSTNNVTWTDVHAAETGLNQNEGTDNPNIVDIDISSVAANQATVYVRFRYQGDYDYYWFVDDVQLYEPSAFDLATYSIEPLSKEYTKIPLLQATTLNLKGVVKNAGINAATGGTALFEVINASTQASVYSQSINLPTLASGATQVVAPSLAFLPPYAGVFKTKLTVTLAGDGNAANNIKESLPIEISDSVYARDDGMLEDILGVGAGPGEDGTAGQNFVVNANGSIKSITFYMKDTLDFDPSGTPIYFTIHAQPNDSTAPGAALAYTDTLVAMPGMIPPGGAYYTLRLHGGALNVTSGLYFVGFHEVLDLLPMGFSQNIASPGAVWVHWNSIPPPFDLTGWAQASEFGYNIAYLIRPNFGSSVGISEQDHTFETLIYPNPGSNVLVVSLPTVKDAYTISLWDAMGKMVLKKVVSGTEQVKLDVSQLATGVYSAQVMSGNVVDVQKIIIKRP